MHSVHKKGAPGQITFLKITLAIVVAAWVSRLRMQSCAEWPLTFFALIMTCDDLPVLTGRRRQWLKGRRGEDERGVMSAVVLID